MDLNKEYWEARYSNQQTAWDIGSISKPIKQYTDQLGNKELKILVPGAGNSYEAEYLFRKGFKNVFVLDLARQPLENFAKRLPDFPKEQLLEEDFFTLNMKFDLVMEQTFFCALDPSLRPQYAKKMFDLLTPKGKLTGLLFHFPLVAEGPPFGGNLNEYRGYFDTYFNIKTLGPCYNSIKPREGRELFFIFESRNEPKQK